MRRIHYGPIARMVALALATAQLMPLACAAPVMSSPEGTVTSRVQQKGVLVYAPRSASAKKIIFDTPDKQLIYAPDTTLRKFFDSRADDFGRGKLEYAKTTILGDVVELVREGGLVEEMLRETVERYADDAIKPRAPTDKEVTSAEKRAIAAERKRNVDHLIQALSHELERENYPNVRDVDIERVLQEFTSGSPWCELTRANGTNKCENSAPQVELLRQELELVLKHQRFVRRVIDVAVEKRIGLFNGGVSPASSLKSTQARFASFAKRNLGPELISALVAFEQSLWDSFVSLMAAGEDPLLRRPATTGGSGPLSGTDLRTYSKALRGRLQKHLERGSTLEIAVRKALEEDPKFLKASTSPSARSEDFNRWRAALKADTSLTTRYEALKTAAAELNAKRGELDDKAKRELGEKAKLDVARERLDESLGVANKAVATIEAAPTKALLDTLIEQLTVDTRPDPAAVAGSPADHALATRGAALGRLAVKIAGQGAAAATALAESFDSSRQKLLAAAKQTRDAASKLAKAVRVLPTGDAERSTAAAAGGAFAEAAASARAAANEESGSTSAKLTKLVVHVKDQLGPDPSQDISDERVAARKLVEHLSEAGELFAEAKAVGDDSAVAKGATSVSASLTEGGNRAEAFSDARTNHSTAVEQHAQAKGQFDALAKSYEAVLGTEASIGDTTFLAVLKDAFGRANDARPDALKPSTSELQDIAKRSVEAAADQLAAARIATLAVADFPTLEKVLEASVKPEASHDVRIALDTITARFLKTFAGHRSLIESDAAILKAFLDSPASSFPNAANRTKASGLIVSGFLRNWESEASREAKPQQAIDVFDATTNAPAISHLFGETKQQLATAEAFKTEFYRAFRRSIVEAVREEREADYDYWWLSFYPKAVPLGDRKLEGQSVIEVSFPRSAVPDQQYHRWLQDRNFDARDLEVRWRTRVRIAAAVLTDFMTVLDASNLSERYPGIRAQITGALEILTRRVPKQRPRAFKVPRWRYYRERYIAALKLLHKEYEDHRKDTLKAIKSVRARDFLSLERLRADAILRLHPDQLPKAELGKEAAQLCKSIVDESVYGGQSFVVADFGRRYMQTFDGLESSETIGCGPAISDAEAVSEARLSCPAPGEMERNGLRDGALNDLAWRRFGIEHVLYAMSAAAESGASLPFKIDLFANAMFDGSRRYVSPIPVAERKAATNRLVLVSDSQHADALIGVEDNVVPRGRGNSEVALERFLIMKGVIPSDARRTAKRLSVNMRHLRADDESTSFWWKNQDAARLALEEDKFRYRLNKSWGEVQWYCRTAGEIAGWTSPGTDEKSESERARNDGSGSDGVEGVAGGSGARDSSDQLRRLARAISPDLLDEIRLLGMFHKEYEDASKDFEDASSPLEFVPIDRALRAVRSRANAAAWNEKRADYVSDAKYFPSERQSIYLGYPHLWLWELRLERLHEELRTILVNVFFTSYPGVPRSDRVKREFLEDEGRMSTLVYEWLRDLWLDVIEIKERMEEGGAPGNHGSSVCERVDVLVNQHLDRQPYLTPNSREQFRKAVLPCRCPNTGGNDCPDEERSDTQQEEAEDRINENIYEWIEAVTGSQPLMDQLQANLLDHLYAPLWGSLGRLATTERQAVPYKDIEESDFERFRHWGKPRVQQGIQIVDLLPASRDDLVSMSINEAGVLAKAAGRAEAYGMYDVSQANMAREALVQAARSVGGENSSEISPLEELAGQTRSRGRVSDAESIMDAASLARAAEVGGYGASASARGSVFARARSAMAYAKRREYLDAAVTASGRGDNFARWVVRKSDLRSGIAGTDPRSTVAAAHSGYPNGDQPFHIMLKVPRSAVQRDWSGNEYILFNSAYSATAKYSWWKAAGLFGLIARLPLAILNPAWWNDVQEAGVATVYPFKWDVARRKSHQNDLMQEPNYLAGAIRLDSTEKIPYSEISRLIEAEAEFIKLTRAAQSSYLEQALQTLGDDESKIREETRKAYEDQWSESSQLQQLESDKVRNDAEIKKLQEELDMLRSQSPPPSNPEG